MKCQIPQISWHSRDPVLSIDFQPIDGNLHRLASGGTDCHVLIWYVTYNENKAIKVECASDLYRHNKSVNVVRFSPNGELLASGDDEGAMFVWQLKKEREQSDISKDEEIVNKEDWYPLKLLRGHLEDIYDLSWSSDGNYLVSASMDNFAIIWDMQKYQKLHMLPDCKGYVQGVAWDPKNQFIASIGSDRALRIYNINTKKTVYRVQKAPWHVTTEKGNFKARLFYDDTLKSYFRRLCFTPDGELLIVPSGIVDKGDKCTNTTYVFSRHIFNKPVLHLPSGDKYTVAVRCNPFLYKLRQEKTENKENKPMIDLPYRMIFAVAACDSILLYDTEQLPPFAFVSNIHYTHLTDMTWSPDGLTLVASSTDGYCSFLIFTREELGEIYVPEVPVVEESIKITKDTAKEKIKNENANLKVNNENPIKDTTNPEIGEHSSKQQGEVSRNKNLSDEKTIGNTVSSLEIVKGGENKMETDGDNSCSIELVCIKSNSENKSTENTPKCRLQLNFSDHSKNFKNKENVSAKIELHTEYSDDAVSSFNDLESKGSADIDVAENDWKLELSQDEEIPMDVDPQMQVICSPKPEKAESRKEPSPVKITPKRRIPLITLTKKITTTQCSE